MVAWAQKRGIELKYIQPRKPQKMPMLNDSTERFATIDWLNTFQRFETNTRTRNGLDVDLQSQQAKHGYR